MRIYEGFNLTEQELESKFQNDFIPWNRNTCT